MARFTIRVELHNATAKDYTTLATALAAKNITDVITADDGNKYKMPPAEYQCYGELTAVQVRDIAATAAQTTRKKHAILVTEATSRAWIGLDKA